MEKESHRENHWSYAELVKFGKTTLVENFATEFDCFLKLNLDEEEDRLLFTRYKEIHRLIEAIFFHLQKNPTEGSTLLFIDEIQNSPRSRGDSTIFHESDRIFM